MKNQYVLPLLGVLFLAACQDNSSTTSQPASSANEQTAAKKVYRVSSELTKFPVVMHDGNGNVTGFEAELLQAIAEKQNFTIEYNIDSWAGLLTKLESNDTDMILGSVTITEERQKTMDFTESVLPYKTGAMVAPELADAKTFADLRGRKVNLRKNTVYEQYVPIFSVGDGKNMVYPSNVWGQVQSLLTKESEAMIGASITLEYYQKQYPDSKFHIIYEPNAKESHYGWAVKKGTNAELLKKLNDGLAQVKADGTYKQLHQKYWGQ